MDRGSGCNDVASLESRKAALRRLRASIRDNRPWVDALLETVASWTVSCERYRGRSYNYFISGEAFDWLLLAERLVLSVGGLVPKQEMEDLLFDGRLPANFDRRRFRELIGAEKYRGYLNYLYGVIVEEAIHLAVEDEVRKRRICNGFHYEHDPAEEAFENIYQVPRSILFDRFRDSSGYPTKKTVGLQELKEFTYWLFKYRLKNSDSAKIASDTKKGLDQLYRMGVVSSSLFGADSTEVLPTIVAAHCIKS